MSPSARGTGRTETANRHGDGSFASATRAGYAGPHRGLGVLIAASVALAAAAFASAESASCRPTSAAENRARADVIFDGVVLEGPTATGVQRFRVNRYLKGRGPQVVRVHTGNVRRADGTGSVTSVSVIAKRGERWRIYARGRANAVLRTSICDGSRKR